MVTFTASVTDPSVIAGSINLQRLDASGAVAGVQGVLRDDGQGGDAVAGDKIYTLRVSLQESVAGPIHFRVSAAFRGGLTRVFSGIVTVTAVSQGAANVTIRPAGNDGEGWLAAEVGQDSIPL